MHILAECPVANSSIARFPNKIRCSVQQTAPVYRSINNHGSTHTFRPGAALATSNGSSSIPCVRVHWLVFLGRFNNLHRRRHACASRRRDNRASASLPTPIRTRFREDRRTIVVTVHSLHHHQKGKSFNASWSEAKQRRSNHDQLARTKQQRTGKVRVFVFVNVAPSPPGRSRAAQPPFQRTIKGLIGRRKSTK